MKRRDLLSTMAGASAVGIAGCLDERGEDATQPLSDLPNTTQCQPSDKQAPPSTEETEQIQRQVILSCQDSLHEGYQMQINAEVLKPTITADHTARLRVTTTNNGPKRAFSIGTGGCDLFNRSRAASDEPAGLWLYRSDSTNNLTRKENKWVRDLPSDQQRDYPEYGCSPTVYDRGQSRSTEYVVWDDYRVEGYLEPDAYRWEEDVQIWEDASADFGDSPSATVTWGFTLTVEKTH